MKRSVSFDLSEEFEGFWRGRGKKKEVLYLLGTIFVFLMENLQHLSSKKLFCFGAFLDLTIFILMLTKVTLCIFLLLLGFTEKKLFEREFFCFEKTKEKS